MQPYRTSSSILHGANHTTSELKDISLKSNVSSKYVIQNELMHELFTQGTQKEDHDTTASLIEFFSKIRNVDNYDKRIAEIQEEIKALKQQDPTTNELQAEIDDLDNMIDSLADEFLSNPSENQVLKGKNDEIYSKYCNKYNKWVYEITNEGSDEVVDMDVDESNQPQQVLSGGETQLYYKLDKIKFPVFDYKSGDSVLKVNERREKQEREREEEIREQQRIDQEKQQEGKVETQVESEKQEQPEPTKEVEQEKQIEPETAAQ